MPWGPASPKPCPCLHTEPGTAKTVQEGCPWGPGLPGEAPDLGTPDLTRQHVSDMLGTPVLPEGPREALRQLWGAEPEDTEGSCVHSGLLGRPVWGDQGQDGPPQKGDQDKEHPGGEELDRDRDIDESSPQDSTVSQVSPPSQISPNLQSPPAHDGSPPEPGSRETTGAPTFPAEGAVPLPVDFLSKISTETQLSEPGGLCTGPGAGGQDTAPKFTFHVEIKTNTQKETGASEVDSDGAAPKEEQEPQSPSEGENTSKTNLPEASAKQPAAGLQGKPVSRVPQLKGL